MMNVRVFYTKTGRAKYISHLDMLRFMGRALGRSKLPVWYTEGFNRHIYTTFALPLSLGFESLCEFMDFRLTCDEYNMDEVVSRLDACLTPDVRVVRAAAPVYKPDTIAWADFTVGLSYSDDVDPAVAIEAFTRFSDQPSITVEKKTKRGTNMVDLKPFLELQSAAVSEGKAVLELRLAAGGQMNVNPMLLLGEFARQSALEPELTSVLRRRVLTGEFVDFI